MARIILGFMAIGVMLALIGCTQTSTSANQSGALNMTNNTNVSGNSGKEVVMFETSMGNIEVELDRAKAPITVDNFVKYVNAGHYDNTLFHRVISGFMIQGGAFTPDGGEKPVNAPIKLESSNGLRNYAGTIAMARTNDANSATAQFYINTVNNQFLDYRDAANPGYAVFGKVISGMDVVKKIENVPTESRTFYDDWPVTDVVIYKAYME